VPAPRRPDLEPLATDEVTVVLVGTVLWAVALVATLVLHSRIPEHGRGAWVWICAAGLFLGLVGLRHVRRRRAALNPPVADPSAAPPRSEGG
jgi:hypothetical protein